MRQKPIVRRGCVTKPQDPGIDERSVVDAVSSEDLKMSRSSEYICELVELCRAAGTPCARASARAAACGARERGLSAFETCDSIFQIEKEESQTRPE
jgi:hypothetical protein